MSKTHVWAALLAAISFASAAQAVTVPYTEDFTNDNANWQNNARTLATFNAAGGPDGSSYISVPFNFQASAVDSTPVLFRANPSTPLGPASGGNFIGDWLAGEVSQVRAYVRHNATEPLTYFGRVATPTGYPGFIVGDEVAVEPNVWTAIDLWISPNNSNNFDEGMPFGSVFNNIGFLQFGVFVPSGLAGVNQAFTFDVDQVTVDVPEPTSLAMAGLAVAAIGLVCRRVR
jgi:hypothetical protein